MDPILYNLKKTKICNSGSTSKHAAKRDELIRPIIAASMKAVRTVLENVPRCILHCAVGQIIQIFCHFSRKELMSYRYKMTKIFS